MPTAHPGAQLLCNFDDRACAISAIGGRKWSVASERSGIPIGWVIDGANRNDVRLLEPTLDVVNEVGLLSEVGMLHLDRGYDSGAVRRRLGERAESRARYSRPLRRSGRITAS